MSRKTNTCKCNLEDILKRALDDLKLFMDDVGGCDHSTGICCCETFNLMERIEEHLSHCGGKIEEVVTADDNRTKHIRND